MSHEPVHSHEHHCTLWLSSLPSSPPVTIVQPNYLLGRSYIIPCPTAHSTAAHAVGPTRNLWPIGPICTPPIQITPSSHSLWWVVLTPYMTLTCLCHYSPVQQLARLLQGRNLHSEYSAFHVYIFLHHSLSLPRVAYVRMSWACPQSWALLHLMTELSAIITTSHDCATQLPTWYINTMPHCSHSHTCSRSYQEPTAHRPHTHPTHTSHTQLTQLTVGGPYMLHDSYMFTPLFPCTVASWAPAR